jgi:hypothetical protein
MQFIAYKNLFEGLLVRLSIDMTNNLREELFILAHGFRGFSLRLLGSVFLDL